MLTLEVLNYKAKEEETIALEAIVSQPIDSIVYSKYINDKNVELEYIESDEVNSEDHLNINQLHWKITSNNENYFENYDFSFRTKSFSLFFRDVLISDKTYLNKEGIAKPLFYKHKRKIQEANIYYVSLGDTVDVEYGYKIQGNYLYTNYINSYNKKTGDYKIYYVSGIDTDGNSFNELLNVEPCFKRASWEDIDIDTGLLEGDVYTVSQSGNHFIYEVNKDADTCSKDKLYVKGLDTNIIQLLGPEAFSIKNVWTPRITNGYCFDNLIYKIPEYERQAFNPIYGLIRLDYKDCFRVSSSLIKLPVNKIKIDPNENIEMNVFIYNEEQNIIKALTTDARLIGTRFSTSDILFEEGILSWDEHNGIVELSTAIDITHIVEASFYYNTDTYIYNYVNLNPFQNEKIIHNKYYFYLKPFTGKPLSRHVHHFLLDEEDRILESSEFPMSEDDSLIGKYLSNFKVDYVIGQNYMELGEITYDDISYVDEILHFDVSKKHLLKESNYEDIINRQFKILQSEYGYGEEGQVYQNNDILYIEAPASLLSKNGGTYSEAQLDRLFRRKLPAHIDIVVDYIFPKSKLQIDTLSANKVSITFTWEGPGTYILERSKTPIDNPIEIYRVEQLEYVDSIIYEDNDVDTDGTYYYTVRIDSHPKSNVTGVKVL